MVWQLVTVIGFVVLAGLLVAVLVARLLYAGPCPRCGRPIRRGTVDCSHCGFCTRGTRPPG
jgi:hypothetical protein